MDGCTVRVDPPLALLFEALLVERGLPLITPFRLTSLGLNLRVVRLQHTSIGIRNPPLQCTTTPHTYLYACECLGDRAQDGRRLAHGQVRQEAAYSCGLVSCGLYAVVYHVSQTHLETMVVATCENRTPPGTLELETSGRLSPAFMEV
jgi:hypothetical protein